MTRISDASTINALIGDMLRTQQRRMDTNFQVVTGKVSPEYAGISFESQRLVSLETSRDINTRYMQNNQTQELRLDVMETTLDSIRKTIADARESVINFASRDVFTENSIEELQTFAFNSLKTLEGFLNVDVDGQFLFSGSRVNTEPVDIGHTSLDSFQSTYDGAFNTYPTTRDAHLSELAVSADTNVIDADNITNGNFLTFVRDDDGDATDGGRSSIEATSALFSDYDVGSIITVSGTASNNGDYRVDEVSSDGTKIYITTEMFTDETLPRRLADETAATAATFDLPGGTQLTNTNTGNVTFDRDAGTITGLTANAFSSVSVGDIIEIGGTSVNNGTIKVTAVSADNLTLTVASEQTLTIGDDPALTSDDTHRVVFSRSNDTVTVDTAGTFASSDVGRKITVAGTARNNGTYTIESVSSDGRTATIASSKLERRALSLQRILLP